MSQDDVLRQLLEEIHEDPAVTQRKLASNLGLSIGAVNWHLKRCAAKGLIKLGQVPVKRYLYYLTPEGFSEKARLTAEFMRGSLKILRVGRQQYVSFGGQRPHGFDQRRRQQANEIIGT